MLYFISEQKYVSINQFWCLLLYCRICSVCFSGLQRMRTRINLQSTWKSQIILVMNYMNDTCTNSSLVAKVFSLLSTGVYQHSKLIVPKKKRGKIMHQWWKKKCQVFEICKTSSNDIEKIHDLCIDQGKYRVYLLFTSSIFWIQSLRCTSLHRCHDGQEHRNHWSVFFVSSKWIYLYQGK